MAASWQHARAVISEERPAPSSVQVGNPHVVWYVKMTGLVTLDLGDPGVTCDIGKQLPLFQKKENSYVAVTTSGDGARQLCEFPRSVLNESTAWISEQKLLVFGRRTMSIPGTFTFEPDELVPLLRENKDSYTVEAMRNDYRVPIDVPKKTPGVFLVPVQSRDRTGSVASRPALVLTAGPGGIATPAGTAPASPDRNALLDFKLPSAAGMSPELEAARLKEEMLQDLLDKLEQARKQRSLELASRGQEDLAAAKDAMSQDQPPALVPPSPAVEPVPVAAPVAVSAKATPAPATERDDGVTRDGGSLQAIILTTLRDNAMTVVLFLAIVPLAMLLAARLRGRHPQGSRRSGEATPPAPPVASEVYTFHSVGESIAPEAMHGQLDGHGDLSGTLAGCILPQVVQFFCSARETGLMIIRQDNGFIEELVFRDGQIIDAHSGRMKARDAVRIILQQRDGKFFFRRGNLTNQTPVIAEDTMGLLLEAQKALDEARGTRHD